MKIEVIGKQHLNGTSRKTGKPYDFTVVHFNITQFGVEGLSACTLNIGNELIAYNDIHLGVEYIIEFDFHGRVVKVSPAKKD